MATDVRRLRAGDLCRLLNSTPLGECLGERRLRRQRVAAGLRIAADGDPERVDLLRYVAWLFDRRHAPNDRRENALSGYDAHRERARLRNAALSVSGRDIGELPPCADPARRDGCRTSLRSFCETYFARTFTLAWSDDHLKVIAKIERAVLEGGLFAMAMPRGSGKTSLCETACLWAVLYGHREFVALVGCDEEHAEEMLDSLRSELESNDLLLADFPEACVPIRALEGIHQRAAGQLHRGRQTHVGWTSKELVLPTIETDGGPAPSSGAIVRVAGLTGRVRGMKHKRRDGSSVRPSLVLVDDPQTDESARSESQCAARERILAGAVLGLAGPGRKIAGLMTLTVVRPGDLADRLLDTARHPQWQGERTKLMASFPRDETLWARYADLRADGLRAGRGLADATAFYVANRGRMDEGAKASWEARFNPDEVSAIQHGMNLRLQDEAAFFAEYQNEPLPERDAESAALSIEAILDRAVGPRCATVPDECETLTMFVDVQQNALFWLVAAWDDRFGGHVVDCGTEPKQPEERFTLKGCTRTLAMLAPKAGPDGAIRAGLSRLVDTAMTTECRREDGTAMRIDRCLIDANWGQSTELVYAFCRRSPHAARLTPSHGRFVGAASVPFSEFPPRPGERVGLNWRMPSRGHRSVRHVTFDTNFWKSFVFARLAVPVGDPGALTVFSTNAGRRQLLAEHLTSEYRVRTFGRGREVDEWRHRPDGGDNHWLDCLVGTAVAASIEGVILEGMYLPRRKRRVWTQAMLDEAKARNRRGSDLSTLPPVPW